MFDSISTLAVASSMRELYRLVLVDTPLAPYFAESLTSGLTLNALLGPIWKLFVDTKTLARLFSRTMACRQGLHIARETV